MNKISLTRQRKLGFSAVALLLIALLSWPANTLACACCAEPGTWFDRIDRISEYERGELDRLRFDTVAKTYMTEAGEDGIKGISNPADEYSITLVKQQGRWELRFKDQRGRTGTLSLVVPTTVGAFGVDMRDTPADTETVLYKEWRLTGPLVGAGIFKRGSTPQTRYRLVMQGSGNACTSAEMFTSWTLQVFGPRASYSFYGKFKDPASNTQSKV